MGECRLPFPALQHWVELSRAGETEDMAFPTRSNQSQDSDSPSTTFSLKAFF
eukprot:m.73438 g.73438  ORF g.73438 m.73438 type:complete len:52 (-) comp24557_c0_seq2:2212-2367(-)